MKKNNYKPNGKHNNFSIMYDRLKKLEKKKDDKKDDTKKDKDTNDDKEKIKGKKGELEKALGEQVYKKLINKDKYYYVLFKYT